LQTSDETVLPMEECELEIRAVVVPKPSPTRGHLRKRRIHEVLPFPGMPFEKMGSFREQ
jgi:hypothetical protein